jgi:AraC family transcriptional regulator
LLNVVGPAKEQSGSRLLPLIPFEERDIGDAWLPRQVRRGDIFVTGSKTPYELRWRSPLGAEMDVIHIHLAVDHCLAAFEMVYENKAGGVEVTDFYGRDERLAHRPSFRLRSPS